MKTQIKKKIDDPEQLENLYRANEKEFEKSFFAVFPEIQAFPGARFWKARLDFQAAKSASPGIKKADLLILFVACAITGLLIELPKLFHLGIPETVFFQRNAGLIALFGLSLYSFLTKDSVKTKQVLFALFVFLASALYINLLPVDVKSDSILLAYIHLPLMIWCLYGIIFIDFDTRSRARRMEYLKYNGDLAILLAIIAITGGILTAVTIGLFAAIEVQIENFYMDYIVLVGLVSAPIAGTYIARTFPFVVNKIAPLIASIFSPIVLITLVIYLASIAVTGKDPYTNRDFLMVFNLMLLGVMAIIVFSVSESPVNGKQRFPEFILFALSIVTMIIDLVALSAIVYRLAEFGFTPNRIAVLGSNVLIFVHLILIMLDLYRVNFKSKNIKQVELTITNYLPVYALWTVFMVFALPALFGMK